MAQPTVSQIEQSSLAYNDFVEVIDRLIKEGFDYRSILAGAGSAIAQSIMVSAGPGKVAEWFALQSAMTMNLGKDLG